MAEKIWFVTGASRGLGRIWVEAALARGDKVAATARDATSLADLKRRYGDAVLPLALDVTDGAQATEAVRRAHAHFGRLDVVVNNAGYSLVGTVEEVAEDDVRALFETNYFGTLRVIRVALPLLRMQGHGHIVGVSSSLGLVPLPLIGTYCASKAAVESIHESLAAEVAQFGIKVTLIEPGAYATDFGTPASVKLSEGMAEYATFRQRLMGGIKTAERGEPEATAAAVLAMVDAEQPPLRFILGSDTLPRTRAAYAERIAGWERWAAVSNAAQGTSTRRAA